MKPFYKKGFELSINFLVTLIIAVVVFSFGIVFIYNLTGQGEGLKDMTITQIDKSLDSILCSPRDKVCISRDTKTIPKGEFETFGIKIINVQDEQPFEVTIALGDPVGFTPQNVPIVTDQSNLPEAFPDSRDFTLRRNQEHQIGFGIEVPKGAPKGTYIFDVQVIASGVEYNALKKIRVKVP